jgi:hypothetical protein
VFDEFGRGRASVSRDNEVVDQVVESGAKVVQTMSNDEAESGGGTAEKPNPDDVLASVAISLNNEAV